MSEIAKDRIKIKQDKKDVKITEGIYLRYAQPRRKVTGGGVVILLLVNWWERTLWVRLVGNVALAYVVFIVSNVWGMLLFLSFRWFRLTRTTRAVATWQIQLLLRIRTWDVKAGRDVKFWDRAVKVVCWAAKVDLISKSTSDKPPPGIPVGRWKDTGKWVVVQPRMNVLVAGVTGGGKSTVLNLILRWLAEQARYEVCAIDMAGGVEFHPWRGMFTRYGTDDDSARELLRYLDAELDRREAVLVEGGDRRWESRHGPFIYLVIDELAELARCLRGREYEDTMCRLSQMGRKCGIYLVCATQHPNNTVVSTAVRDQFRAIIGTRCERRATSTIIFGDGVLDADVEAGEEPWDLSRLRALNENSTEPREFLVKGPDHRRPRVAHTVYTSDDEVEEYTYRGARLRGAGETTSQTASDETRQQDDDDSLRASTSPPLRGGDVNTRSGLARLDVRHVLYGITVAVVALWILVPPLGRAFNVTRQDTSSAPEPEPQSQSQHQSQPYATPDPIASSPVVPPEPVSRLLPYSAARVTRCGESVGGWPASIVRVTNPLDEPYDINVTVGYGLGSIAPEVFELRAVPPGKTKTVTSGDLTARQITPTKRFACEVVRVEATSTT